MRSWRNCLQIFFKYLFNEQLTAITIKFQNHSNIIKMNSNNNLQEKHSFKSAHVKYVEHIIKSITNEKTFWLEIPLHILKQSSFTYPKLTDCINGDLSRDIFPDSLKFTNITPVHKKTKLLVKKIIGQWIYYLYFQKYLKTLFMINLVNIWKNT